MSLKLGNTNIAGTQVLYSTTGNNTDGAMTQAATTTQLNLKANDTNVVHKTGNETIAGVKTFTADIFAQGFINLGTSTNTWGKQLQFRDTTGKRIARIQPMAIDTTNNRVGIWVNNADNTVEKGISIDSNGTTYAPASDKNNSIVTTVNKSKSANGYFRLGNGLIIQWGRSSTTDGYVSFPTPFSNACTAVIPTRISSGDAQSNIYENASTTRFRVKIYGGYSSSSYFYWIAVGY